MYFLIATSFESYDIYQKDPIRYSSWQFLYLLTFLKIQKVKIILPHNFNTPVLIQFPGEFVQQEFLLYLVSASIEIFV
jgi:hypothetical protein